MAGAVNARPTVTTQQILQGAGKVLVDGVEAGGYMGGVKVTMNQSESFIKSDISLGEIDSEITATDVQISTELEEATLENMAWAMFGISSSSVLSGVSSKTLDVIPPQSMRELGLVFEGMSATNRNKLRTFTVYRAVKIGNSGLTLQRGTKTTIPVTLKALQNAQGKYMSITDATV